MACTLAIIQTLFLNPAFSLDIIRATNPKSPIGFKNYLALLHCNFTLFKLYAGNLCLQLRMFLAVHQVLSPVSIISFVDRDIYNLILLVDLNFR